jgi:ubiquinone/menaquinone biosynthesis C-methylase UbiE
MTDKVFNIANAVRLDAPERIESLPPADVIVALKIVEDEIIADIGAGTGYFAIPMAQVASRGMVHAVDAQPAMLQIMKDRAAGIDPLQLIQAHASATTLQSSSCDLAFYANVWHEFEQKDKVLLEARRILRGTGRIAILDWRPDVERTSGPPLDHRIPVTQAVIELNSAGFNVTSSQNIGRYSWLVQATLCKN